MTREISFEFEELRLAWRRVKWDLERRVFVTTAFEKELLDLGEDEWLGQLCNEIIDDSYSPQTCEIVEEAKPGYHLRPGARLEME
jgi:hypothetical protein